MAHSNHYFKLTTDIGRSIDLISRGPEYGPNDEVLDNMIQLTVTGPIYGTGLVGEVGIFLNEKEQDDLIAGILERRSKVLTSLGDLSDEISADTGKQSAIRPVK